MALLSENTKDEITLAVTCNYDISQTPELVDYLNFFKSVANLSIMSAMKYDFKSSNKVSNFLYPAYRISNPDLFDQAKEDSDRLKAMILGRDKGHACGGYAAVSIPNAIRAGFSKVKLYRTMLKKNTQKKNNPYKRVDKNAKRWRTKLSHLKPVYKAMGLLNTSDWSDPINGIPVITKPYAIISRARLTPDGFLEFNIYADKDITTGLKNPKRLSRIKLPEYVVCVLRANHYTSKLKSITITEDQIIIPYAKEVEYLTDCNSRLGVNINYNIITVYDPTTNIVHRLDISGQVEKIGIAYSHRSHYKVTSQNKTKSKIMSKYGKKRHDRYSNLLWNVAIMITDIAVKSKTHINLEDLQGIRASKSRGRKANEALHSWPFYQLQECVVVEAAKQGIRTHKIKPYMTSQKCHKCQEKTTRVLKDMPPELLESTNIDKSRLLYCKKCNMIMHRDDNAAINVSVSNPISGGPCCGPDANPPEIMRTSDQPAHQVITSRIKGFETQNRRTP